MKSFRSSPGRLLFRSVMLGVLASASWSSFAAAEDTTPSPHPDPALIGDHKREMVLQLKFGANGKVDSCQVIKESGSPKLDKTTVSFVLENWKMTSEAGRTARIPIDFSPAPKVASQPKTPPKNTPASSAENASPSALGGYSSNGGLGGTHSGAVH